MADDGDVGVWVVAGCLFEVSLSAGAQRPWRWTGPAPGPEVTLLAQAIRDDEHRFRFRAEAAGASVGGVELGFRAGDVERAVFVRIAPEADLA